MAKNGARDAASPEVRCAYAVHDHLTRMVMPLCSAMVDRPSPEIPITKQLIIADISSLSYKQVWQLKSYLKGFSDLLALNYPEVLDQVLVSILILWSCFEDHFAFRQFGKAG